VPIWPVVLLALLVVASIAATRSLRERSGSTRPLIAGFLLATSIGLVLEMGVSNPATVGLVSWLDSHFVIYRGMRDAGKWAALLGLAYSQLVGIGAITLLSWLRKRVREPGRLEWTGGFATALLLAVPLYYGNGLLFGSHGEIRPSQYPAGWYAADAVLASDGDTGRALFLPWHEYMSYSFVLNQNRVIAPPAPAFFDIPVVVSADPEVPGVAPPTTPDQEAISALVNAGGSGEWAQVLAADHIKYVLLARELDWASYSFLNTQTGLVQVGDYGSIVLYRNDLFQN